MSVWGRPALQWLCQVGEAQPRATAHVQSGVRGRVAAGQRAESRTPTTAASRAPATRRKADSHEQALQSMAEASTHRSPHNIPGSGESRPSADHNQLGRAVARWLGVAG